MHHESRCTILLDGSKWKRSLVTFTSFQYILIYFLPKPNIILKKKMKVRNEKRKDKDETKKNCIGTQTHYTNRRRKIPQIPTHYRFFCCRNQGFNLPLSSLLLLLLLFLLVLLLNLFSRKLHFILLFCYQEFLAFDYHSLSLLLVLLWITLIICIVSSFNFCACCCDFQFSAIIFEIATILIFFFLGIDVF